MAQRARILRAETLVRAGEPLAAAQELTLARAGVAGWRATALALSYLMEDRHAQAHAWTRRARLAYRRREGAGDLLAAIVENAALLGLDQIDRAQAAAAREVAGGARALAAMATGVAASSA